MRLKKNTPAAKDEAGGPLATENPSPGNRAGPAPGGKPRDRAERIKRMEKKAAARRVNCEKRHAHKFV